MILVQLFASFFKIGLFSFGGGYAMISLIADEIFKYQWLSQSEFVRIIGIAGMTPGPIAINSATFVGYKMAGFAGAFFATLGVSMPSFFLVLALAGTLFRHADHPLLIQILKGMKSVVAGLIFAAAVTVGKSTLAEFNVNGGLHLNWPTIAIAVIVLTLSLRTKVHPILLIVFSGILGFAAHFLTGISIG
jgi:chromate transporter